MNKSPLQKAIVLLEIAEEQMTSEYQRYDAPEQIKHYKRMLTQIRNALLAALLLTKETGPEDT